MIQNILRSIPESYIYYYCSNGCENFYTINNKINDSYLYFKDKELIYYGENRAVFIRDRNSNNKIRIPYFNYRKINKDELYKKIKTYLLFS